MIDCWFTQIRLVSHYFPNNSIRPLRNTQQMMHGDVFAFVLPTVRRRDNTCPAHVVTAFRDRGFTIIHIEEPQE